MDRKNTNIVFGTGICLQNNWNLVIKHFRPEYLSDNSAEKWHSYPMTAFPKGKNLECIPPEQIRKLTDPHVLITIGDPYIVSKVREQIESMDIPCEAISDYLDLWGPKEDLPDHLCTLKDTMDQRRILLFNSPEHDNVGDHLISVAELEFIKTFFPNEICIEITDMEYLWFHTQIREYIHRGDILLITGGGFLGSMWLYNGELNVRNILCEYPKNRVVIMPQTIYFEDNLRGEQERIKTTEIYQAHPNLVVCLRERNSYKLMCELLKEKTVPTLMPDMALLLDFSREQRRREGVLLCLRQDKESILRQEQREEIISGVEQCGMKYTYTLMHTGHCYNKCKRGEEIQKKALQMKGAEIVITDTLHAMILCAITGTPCLAFDNVSHKVSGVYEWIKDTPYIHLYNEGENIYACINSLVRQGAGHYDAKSLWSYYEQLSMIIKEG